VRRPAGKPIFGAALSSDDSTSSTSASTRRHPLVKIRVRVGPSRIAGQGLFAEQEIKQGTKIIRYIGERITHEESERRLAAGNAYIFGLDEYFALDGSAPRNTARYINHSCEPNCQTEQFGRIIWIVAIRDIQVGEELTYNYGYELNDEPAEPCHCGAKNCCGYILGPHYWDRLQQPAPQ
jgi:SET domain-containing protein